jgi:predicted XRE-type DNA-binding protein
MDKMVHGFKSVWDALADTPEQAANLRARSALMQQITEVIASNGWTQIEAGAHCGVTQPRMNDLLRGRISRFSLDALVNMAAALGRPVPCGTLGLCVSVRTELLGLCFAGEALPQIPLKF